MQQALEEWLADQRQVINASRLAGLMKMLFGQQLERGPELLADESVVRRLAPLQGDGIAMTAPPLPPPSNHGELTSVSTATASTLIPPRQGRGRLVALGAAGAILIAGIGVGVGLSTRPDETESTPRAASAPRGGAVGEGDSELPQAEANADEAPPELRANETGEANAAEASGATEAAVPDAGMALAEGSAQEVEATEAAEPPSSMRRRSGGRRPGRPGFVADPGF